MTKEQLDAIRARVEAATPGPWLTDSCLDVYTEQVREIDPDIGIELYKTVYSNHTAGPEGTQPWHDTHFMAHAREDVPALFAEVERLKVEVESKTQQNVALIGQNGRLQQEVERLNALGALQSADIQRLTRRVAEDEADWLALRAEAAAAIAAARGLK